MNRSVFLISIMWSLNAYRALLHNETFGIYILIAVTPLLGYLAWKGLDVIEKIRNTLSDD